MYESHWQLKQKPFENSADPRFYFPGESHQAALLKLRYAIENRRGGALLAGGSGTGKTLLTGMLRQMLSEQFSPFVHLVFPQMSTAELLAYLAGELDGSTDDSGGCSVEKSIRRIEHFLAENTDKGRHAVVAVDEAHLIDNTRTLEAMRLLLNFESAGPSMGEKAGGSASTRAGLTLLMVGQTGLLPTLERMPQLDERLAVKCLLRRFTQQETADYVAHRLKVAEAVRPIFEPDSLPVLYRLTHGVPRQINRLCDLSLLIGFAEERHTIDADQLEAVCHELVAVAPE
ncbi:MAG: ExeA family protein [Planctomycetota bacterium]|jgi:general secretion pathway protein A